MWLKYILAIIAVSCIQWIFRRIVKKQNQQQEQDAPNTLKSEPIESGKSNPQGSEINKYTKEHADMSERAYYFIKHYPNDTYVSKYGMSYRNFVRELPVLEDNKKDMLFKTTAICLIGRIDLHKEFMDYLRFIEADVCRNMRDSDTAFSIRQHTERSINSFLIKNRVEGKKPNMFYEDAFLIISYACRSAQEKQMSHLVGKTINGALIKRLSDIVCFPRCYFEGFENTVRETKCPADTLSIKMDYIVNTLDGKISAKSFEKLVGVLLNAAADLYANMGVEMKGLEAFLYVKNNIQSFFKEDCINPNIVSEFFYDECFLIVICKIQEEKKDRLDRAAHNIRCEWEKSMAEMEIQQQEQPFLVYSNQNQYGQQKKNGQNAETNKRDRRDNSIFILGWVVVAMVALVIGFFIMREANSLRDEKINAPTPKPTTSIYHTSSSSLPTVNLLRLHEILTETTPGFTIDFFDFCDDMADENNRHRLHENLGKSDSNFTVSFEEFSRDLGFAQTPSISNNTEKLYKALQLEGYSDLGSYSEFESRLKDENSRMKLHEAMSNDGFEDVGSFEDFNNKLGYVDSKTYSAPSENTLAIMNHDIGFRIPSNMEVRKDGSMIEGVMKEMGKIHYIEYSTDKITLQPKGLNENKKEALGVYARAIINVRRGNSNDFPSIDKWSRDEIEYMKKLNDESIKADAKKVGMTISAFSETKIKEIGGKKSMYCSYVRQSANGADSPVFVQSYRIPDNDKCVEITLSYRKSETHLWESDFKEIIESFDIK